MNKAPIIFVLALLISVPFFSQSTIFTSGENWQYYDAGSTPANDAQGDSWIELDFDDTSWSYGNAELGYGDSDETTLINSTALTGYFRKTITATALEVAYSDLILEAIRDDGIIVHLNGIEVWRDNMPAGEASYGTFSSTTISGSAESTWISNTISNSLVLGSNILAIEIHQRSAGSSDLSFDFRLLGTAANTTFITDSDTWKYLDDGGNQGTAWYGTGFNDTSWASGPAELGYGDSDEATAVSYGPSSTNKYPTTYFRHSFNVPDHTLFNDLSLEAIRDDGMAVYLNGALIWTDNMPGSWDYSSYSSAEAVPEDVWINTTIANSLVTGTNVIAVEIHQRNATSSDISFNFRLTANFLVPVVLRRGPYLQTGTSTGVKIKWRTNTSTESIINYGTSLAALSSNVTDNTLTIDHEVKLTGLTPNTKYYYNIADSEGVYVSEVGSMFVKTAPNIATKQFVRAWILGDVGTANQDQKDVRDAYYSYISAASTNPDQTDMMLFLGDNAYNDGTDSEYQSALFDIYDDMLKKAVAWSCLGNHDGHSADSNSQTGIYYDIFSFPTAGESGGTSSGTEAYYSFDYANIHFIVLNSYETSRSVGGTMYNWAQSDIQNTSQDWIVTLFHHPPYSKGSHNSDTEIELIEMRENFMPMLELNGVDLILSGHSHCYERSYFLKGHDGISNTFNSAIHTCGSNGDLSGKADTADGAYLKTTTDTEGAVYITTGSAGKESGGSLNHNAMYHSVSQLGSCVLEVEDDGSGGQNLTVKFLRETGAVGDYFTINKSNNTRSTQTNDIEHSNIKIHPTPAGSIINIEIHVNENLKHVKIYNAIGKLIIETNQQYINIGTLKSGLYIVQVVTDKNEYYKNIVIK